MSEETHPDTKSLRAAVAAVMHAQVCICCNPLYGMAASTKMMRCVFLAGSKQKPR